MRTVVQEMRMHCTVYLSYFDQRQVIVDKKSIFQSPIYSIAKGLTHGFGRGDSEDFLAKPLGKNVIFGTLKDGISYRHQALFSI